LLGEPEPKGRPMTRNLALRLFDLAVVALIISALT
jgi:hypothetical protein